jgi:hypothetical protein
MTFAPAITPEKFKSFFTTAQGWGNLTQTRKGKQQENMIAVAYGQLALNELTLAVPDDARAIKASASVQEATVQVKLEAQKGVTKLVFAPPVMITEGRALTVRLEWA